MWDKQETFHKHSSKLTTYLILPRYYNSKVFQENKNDSTRRKMKNFQKRAFAEMVFIKKEKNNSLNKVSDLEHFNQSYNAILEFLS